MVTIPVVCPKCRIVAAVPESFAGRTVRCKHCKTRTFVPIPDEPDDTAQAQNVAPAGINVVVTDDDSLLPRRPRSAWRGLAKPLATGIILGGVGVAFVLALHGRGDHDAAP